MQTACLFDLIKINETQMITDALTNGVQELAFNKPGLSVAAGKWLLFSNGLADTNQTVYQLLNASAWSSCPNMQEFYRGQLCKPL